MMKKSGIYKIVNITNGKLYVGSAVNFNGRWRKHKRELNKGEHHSIYLQRAWDKYRESNFHFEIIEECESLKEVLEEREQYYIDMLKPEYNMCLKAYSQLGMKRSEETKQKMSESKRGKHHSEETKQKMSGENNPNFGKHPSEETRKKLSEARRAKRGENSSFVKLNWDIVHEIRRRYKEEKISQYKLADEYGVARTTIQHIIENRNWKEEETVEVIIDITP